MSVQDSEDIGIDLDDSHEFALRRAARYMSQLYSRQLVSIGLTSAQFTMLRMIHRYEALSMAELAQWIVSDRSTLVRAVQVLRKDGYVTSATAPPSGRRSVLTLTPLGRERLAQARLFW